MDERLKELIELNRDLLDMASSVNDLSTLKSYINVSIIKSKQILEHINNIIESK